MSDDTPKTYTEAQVQELIQTRTAELRESRNTLTAELNKLRPAVAEWEQKATSFQAELATATEATAQLADLQAKHAAAETSWGQERVLLGAGINDPDATNTLRNHYSRATDPGEFSEWFEREGRQIPIIASFLAPHVVAATSTQSVDPTPPAPTSPQMPQANAGRKPAPPAAQPYTPGSIASMDIEEFRRNRDSLLNGLKVPL